MAARDGLMVLFRLWIFRRCLSALASAWPERYRRPVSASQRVNGSWLDQALSSIFLASGCRARSLADDSRQSDS